jgi:hypothetical protein
VAATVTAAPIPTAHAQARRAVRAALVPMAAAAILGALDAAGGPWVKQSTYLPWLAIHLAVAGGLMTAICGTSIMLAVTWANAPAPSDQVVTGQRWCQVAGTVCVAAGRVATTPALVAVGAVLYAVSLLGWAGIVIWTARRATVARFRPAIVGYVVSASFGVIGVGLGASMALRNVTATTRSAHLVVNLLGLVGGAVVATLPFFSSTVARARMNPRATPTALLAVTGGQAVALTIATVAISAGSHRVGAAALAAYGVSVAVLGAALPTPTARQLRFAGPRIFAFWCGLCWWAAAVVASSAEVWQGGGAFDGRWLGVLLIAGFGQLLWGGLGYLLPMLRGGGHRWLTAGFDTTRSWLGLGAVNALGIALATGANRWIISALLAVWVLDSGVRFGLVGTRRRPRPAN